MLFFNYANFKHVHKNNENLQEVAKEQQVTWHGFRTGSVIPKMVTLQNLNHRLKSYSHFAEYDRQ